MRAALFISQGLSQWKLHIFWIAMYKKINLVLTTIESPIVAVLCNYKFPIEKQRSLIKFEKHVTSIQDKSLISIVMQSFLMSSLLLLSLMLLVLFVFQ